MRPPRGSHRFIEAALIAAAVVLALYRVQTQTFGETANSRLATVVALADDGTWYLERAGDKARNPFEARTVDKVVVRGHTISSKPPLLPLAMTGEYVVMRAIWGWDLKDEGDARRILKWMTLTLVTLPYVLGLVFFLKCATLLGVDPSARLTALAALALGTEMTGFASQLNNHVPAAGVLMIHVYLSLSLIRGAGEARLGKYVLAGVTGGLVIALDMPAGIFVAACVLGILRQGSFARGAGLALGMGVPLSLHFALTYAATGSVVPIQFRGDLYLYESSYWRNPVGNDGLNEPALTYLFHVTLGRVGLFSLYPITFAGVVYGVWAVLKRATPNRDVLGAGLVSIVGLVLFYGLGTTNYGGEAYGMRWFIVGAPVLLLMGSPLLSLKGNPFRIGLIVAALGVSIYSAWQCSGSPWQANHEWTVAFFGKSY